jgi:hypothetical protein
MYEKLHHKFPAIRYGTSLISRIERFAPQKLGSLFRRTFPLRVDIFASMTCAFTDSRVNMVLSGGTSFVVSLALALVQKSVNEVGIEV